MEKVNGDGGQIQTQDDLINLLRKHNRKAEKTSALKAQIDFLKLFMNVTSDLLKTTKRSLLEVVFQFFSFKFGEVFDRGC